MFNYWNLILLNTYILYLVILIIKDLLYSITYIDILRTQTKNYEETSLQAIFTWFANININLEFAETFFCTHILQLLKKEFLSKMWYILTLAIFEYLFLDQTPSTWLHNVHLAKRCKINCKECCKKVWKSSDWRPPF